MHWVQWCWGWRERVGPDVTSVALSVFAAAPTAFLARFAEVSVARVGGDIMTNSIEKEDAPWPRDELTLNPGVRPLI